MSLECDDCGQGFGSHGGLQVHQMQCQGRPTITAPPPASGSWAPPPPPTGSRARGTSPLKVVGIVLALAVGSVLGLSAVILAFGSSDSNSTNVASVADVAVAPAETPAGYRTVARPEDRFSIAVPATFEELKLAGADIEAAAGNLESGNPAMAEFLRENKSMVTQARLFAFDSANGNSQLVQRIVAPGARSIMDIPNGTFSAEYKSLGVRDVTEERVKLSNGDAFKVTATITSAAGQAKVTQHVLVKDSVAWILTYTDAGGESTAAATTIAETFRNI